MMTTLGQDASINAWSLFRQSFDVFTILLLAGSLVAVAQIVRVMMEIRGAVIAPRHATDRIGELLDNDRAGEVLHFAERDDTFVSRVVRAALEEEARGAAAMREAAELAASAECARWFRKIELLSVIGNLGPLVGLAGTVWGMILAFTSLGAAGGEAGPTDLSLGISKALFHTLLGLVLAIPCLLVFGVYRSIIDRVCTQAMSDGARLVERILGLRAGS